MPILEDRRAERRLLHGVTGSGKTEVYLRAAAAALEQGRGAIVLVPRSRSRRRSSGVSSNGSARRWRCCIRAFAPSERYAEWRRLREGEARVCVGPRSAVFAPIEDLGLIVVDEEHDASYKHEGDPRYDARDVAAERAERVARCCCSAARPRGRRAPIVCRARAWRTGSTGARCPMCRCWTCASSTAGLHPLTAEALAEVRSARGKAIVLLNRRGWSNFLSCRSCGRVWSCPHCDVALVLHRAGGYVACHHCGHRERVAGALRGLLLDLGRAPRRRHRAPRSTSSRSILDDGNFPVFRLDADAVGAAGAPTELLRRFEAAAVGRPDRHADGRQGPRLPRCDARRCSRRGCDPAIPGLPRRGAHVRADRAARRPRRPRRRGPRARSDDRTARRARSPTRPRHDSDGFLAEELRRREALRYPPFSHLIRIVTSAVESP